MEELITCSSAEDDDRAVRQSNKNSAFNVSARKAHELSCYTPIQSNCCNLENKKL